MRYLPGTDYHDRLSVYNKEHHVQSPQDTHRLHKRAAQSDDADCRLRSLCVQLGTRKVGQDVRSLEG